MGYSTDFEGQFNLNKQLDNKIHKYLVLFNESRRMGRNLDGAFGIEGEFYTFGDDKDIFFNRQDSNIIDHNKAPVTQPGLWCQWVPSEDGNSIEWDGGEKFYNYTEWIVYLINKILAPNGYVLNGKVDYFGEERGDVGVIEIKDNVVYLNGSISKPTQTMRTDVILQMVTLELPQ